jgi:putative ABC transport system permease protein
MFKNYLKTAWRNLLKNKFYSVINIAGLTLGLGIGILILLWVKDELSFDTFHKNSKNIYRLDIQGGTGATKQIFNLGVAPIAQLAKQQLPEVTDGCFCRSFAFRYVRLSADRGKQRKTIS